jgi:hypothetical protein
MAAGWGKAEGGKTHTAERNELYTPTVKPGELDTFLY